MENKPRIVTQADIADERRRAPTAQLPNRLTWHSLSLQKINLRLMRRSFEVERFAASRSEFEAAAVSHADLIENGIHSHGLDLADLSHQFT